MKFLNDRITFLVSVTGTLPNKGNYRYELLEFSDYNNAYKVIFTGWFYYNKTNTVEFDVTDLIKSRKETIYNYPSSGIYIENNLQNKYEVKVYFTSTPLISSAEVVNMVYLYPNKNAYSAGTPIKDGRDDNNSSYLMTALQGWNSPSSIKLIPHYPLKYTSKYRFTQGFYQGKGVLYFYIDNSIGYHIGEEDLFRVDQSQYQETDTIISVALANFFDWQVQSQRTGDFDSTIYYQDRPNDIVAHFDYCPSRYYLQWQDRLGGFQSQAFKDKVTFSESFEVTETKTYTNERRKSLIQVKPSWKLYSDWIDEDIFPLYESIYVSSMLKLYDSYEDEVYDVLVSGNYTEKKYWQDKKMLQLELELELNNTQDILY